MTKKQIEELHSEVTEQMGQHLKRGESVEDAVKKHSVYCRSVVEVIPSLEEFDAMLKDVIIALAMFISFEKCAVLHGLAKGFGPEVFVQIRGVKTFTVSDEALPAWNHLLSKNEESAVAVLAVSYRLFVEKKFIKLTRSEEKLSRMHSKLQKQEA